MLSPDIALLPCRHFKRSKTATCSQKHTSSNDPHYVTATHRSDMYQQLTFSNSSLMGLMKVLDTNSAASRPSSMARATPGTLKCTITLSVSPYITSQSVSYPLALLYVFVTNSLHTQILFPVAFWRGRAFLQDGGMRQCLLAEHPEMHGVVSVTLHRFMSRSVTFKLAQGRLQVVESIWCSG